MFEQTFRNIDDVLRKEAGCATELDYTEQTSWILFLKYLDDLERANEQKAELSAKKYERIIDTKHRWSVWAAPKKKDGSFDHDKALTGDDLIKYVDEKLFPYLKGFRTRAEGANTTEYKIGEIFSEIENKCGLHDPRRSERFVPRLRRQDRGVVLREGRVDAEGLVLQARPDRDPRQDQSAHRRAP
jgi:hypothetical protein